MCSVWSGTPDFISLTGLHGPIKVKTRAPHKLVYVTHMRSPGRAVPDQGFGAKIPFHSPLPKGKKLVLGNLTTRAPNWRAELKGPQAVRCVDKTPGRKAICYSGSRTSERTCNSANRGRLSGLPKAPRRPEGEEGRWWQDTRHLAAEEAHRGGTQWPRGTSGQVLGSFSQGGRYYPPGLDLLRAETCLVNKPYQHINNINLWIAEVPEFHFYY